MNIASLFCGLLFSMTNIIANDFSSILIHEPFGEQSFEFYRPKRDINVLDQEKQNNFLNLNQNNLNTFHQQDLQQNGNNEEILNKMRTRNQQLLEHFQKGTLDLLSLFDKGEMIAGTFYYNYNPNQKGIMFRGSWIKQEYLNEKNLTVAKVFNDIVNFFFEKHVEIPCVWVPVSVRGSHSEFLKTIGFEEDTEFEITEELLKTHGYKREYLKENAKFFIKKR